MTAWVMLCWSMLRMSVFHHELSPGREQTPAAALLHQAPQALFEAHRHDDCQQAKAEQVPGAVVAEELVQRPEDERTNHRSLDSANAADHDHEYRKRRPVDTEGRVRADTQVANE